MGRYVNVTYIISRYQPINSSIYIHARTKTVRIPILTIYTCILYSNGKKITIVACHL